MTRLECAVHMLGHREYHVVSIQTGRAVIRSQTRENTVYTTTVPEGAGLPYSCTCADWEYRRGGDEWMCKHLFLLGMLIDAV